MNAGRHLDLDPAVLRAGVDRVPFAVRHHLAGMRQREGFIFVTSPRSTTPYHLDPECNFLLQIRGDKVCRVAPRSSVSEEDLEQRFSGAHRNLPFGEAAARRAVGFPLFPGDGVSVSFSITFRTAASERDSALYRVNAHLRRLGFTPAPVGSSRPRDALKHGAVRAARRVLRPLRWR